MPAAPSPILVLPHFATTGPPSFIDDSSGVIVGLKLDTPRGEILKGIIEGVNYYLKECVDALPTTGISIADYRTTGGGSKSDVWIQTCADIMGRPFIRPVVTEAGALGAAIIAGVGSGLFASYHEGVAAMVQLDRQFDPDPAQHQRYNERYESYKPLWPLMASYLRGVGK
jgi:sugar (pentulose or hexulose) kinase